MEPTSVLGDGYVFSFCGIGVTTRLTLRPLMNRAIPRLAIASRAVEVPVCYKRSRRSAASLLAHLLAPKYVLLHAIRAHSAIVWTRIVSSCDGWYPLSKTHPFAPHSLQVASFVLGVVLDAFEERL